MLTIAFVQTVRRDNDAVRAVVPFANQDRSGHQAHLGVAPNPDPGVLLAAVDQMHLDLLRQAAVGNLLQPIDEAAFEVVR